MSGARHHRRYLPNWIWLFVAVPTTVLGLGLLAWLLVPPLAGALSTRLADGQESFVIGAEVEVTPDAGWSVQPLGDEGLLLRSPDRMLNVTMVPHEVGGSTAESLSQVIDAARRSDELLSETLANGGELQHVASETRIAAVLEIGDGTVLVGAEANDAVELADYRLAFAELLLDIEGLE